MSLFGELNRIAPQIGGFSMSSQISWFFNDVSSNGGRYNRDRYDPPRVFLPNQKSSFSYEGEVTVGNEYNTYYQQRFIDRTIGYQDVREDLRNEAISEITRSGMFCGGVSAGSIYGGYRTWRAYKNDEISPFNAIVYGIVIGLSLFRSLKGISEASSALDKWEDKIEDLCEQRRQAGKDIEYVVKQDLRGRIVTDSEVVHIFRNALNNMQSDCHMAHAIGGTVIDRFFEEWFVKRNILAPAIINYVFANRETVVENSFSKTLHRRVIDTYSEAFTNIVKDYHFTRTSARQRTEPLFEEGCDRLVSRIRKDKAAPIENEYEQRKNGFCRANGLEPESPKNSESYHSFRQILVDKKTDVRLQTIENEHRLALEICQNAKQTGETAVSLNHGKIITRAMIFPRTLILMRDFGKV